MTLIAVLDILGGIVGLGLGLLYVVLGVGIGAGGGSGQEPAMGAVMGVLGALCGLLGVVQLATGIGLLRLRPWSRTAQIVLAAISLLGIPCGTIFGILVLVYMLKPEVKLLFSGASPEELDPADLEMVERLGQGSGAVVALVAVLVVFVGIAGVGIVAAIAIPSLLRARVSANEASAIGSLRTVVSAQAAYAASNAGLHDNLECLVAPQRCIPGYPATAPQFLDASFATPTRSGYHFRFVPGPGASAEAAPSGQVSPSSLTAFAYIAEPVTHGQTGVRSFCADQNGVICTSPEARLRDAGDGTCPETCSPLD